MRIALLHPPKPVVTCGRNVSSRAWSGGIVLPQFRRASAAPPISAAIWDGAVCRRWPARMA